MTYRLTCAQRRILAECVRAGLVGWLLTCPVAGRHCLVLQARSTTILGFSFSRFVTAAANHFGRDYRPRSPGAAGMFPCPSRRRARWPTMSSWRWRPATRSMPRP